MSDEARTALTAAWGLAIVSALAMGAVIAAAQAHRWAWAAGMYTVAMLTAWASRAERTEYLACRDAR